MADLPEGRRRLDVRTASADEIRNLALDVLSQWGPALGSPVEPRLQSLVDGLDADSAAAAVRSARAAQSLAHRTVDRAGVSGAAFSPPPRSEVDAVVLAEHPWVDDRNLGRAYNQGCYYAWHG